MTPDRQGVRSAHRPDVSGSASFRSREPETGTERPPVFLGRVALAVHVSTMADVQHRDKPVLIINLVDDSKLSHPEAPSVAPRQL